MIEQASSPSGILIIDKPQGWTSHDVVAKVRRVLRTKKVGHAGTLDPMATGVLVVLVGKATKLSETLLNQDKVYRAEVQFGQQTDTGDAEGQVTQEEALNSQQLTEELVAQACQALVGTRMQQVPAYSAVKVEGKKLYELARRGQAMPERPSRSITITSINLDDFSIASSTQPARATITVTCSKGTYIRVLAEELAEQLGTVGHLSQLRRLASGQFTVEEAVTMDELNQSEQAEGLLRQL